MSLIRFSSQATGEVMMFEENARTIFDILGKPYSPKGIVTVAQLPAAIAALKSAIEAEHQQTERARAGQTQGANDDDRDELEGDTPAARVHFAQRAYPMIDMFERALRGNADVLWGV